MKKTSLFLTFLAGGFFAAGAVSAQVCPVCVVAIGAGLGFSRWLGIDDVVTSIWIGALMFSLISWTLLYIKKKGWSFYDDGIVITLVYVVLTYIPLYYAGIVGHPQNKIWGLDKILFGSIVGAVILYVGHQIHAYLKKNNNNKSYFPYQRVAIPVGLLAIVSLVFYFLLQNKII